MSSTAFKVLAMTIILALVLLVTSGAIIHDATPNLKLGLYKPYLLNCFN
jgi:hypothetical protein